MVKKNIFADQNHTTLKIIKVIYILNFFALILPFCSLVGVMLAYVFHDDTTAAFKIHFDYLIRGFWMSLLYFIIAGVLCFIFIGFVLFFICFLWWIIRNAKGLKYALHNEAVPRPNTWLF